MKHFVLRLATLTAILILVPCLTVWAVGAQTSHSSQAGKVNPAQSRVLAFSFPDEHSHGWSTDSSVENGRIPLGTMTTTAVNASPGQTVGWTYYEYQHNCSMGRMVETGPHSGVTGPTTVHFGWMHLPDSILPVTARTYAYNSYKSADGLYSGQYLLHNPVNQLSGFVNVDVTPDNRALVGGHCDESGPIPYQAHIHFDLCTSCNLFDAYVRVPDSLAAYGQEIGNETTWPKFFFQFGSDTVLHIVAQCNTDNTTYLQTIMYFRKVGYEGSLTGWDYPPYLVDSVPTIAHDITGERLGDRVCMAWFGNLPYQQPECDTCSGTSPYEDLWEWGYPDNDMYLQISDDQGVTWDPRKNLTNAGIGEDAFKALCDCSILFDHAGVCHILFHAVPWPADPCIADGETCMESDVYQAKSRLMHWSEDITSIRTVADHTYEPSDSCRVPGFGSHIAKMSLSECDGRLYALWSQFNDIPNGIDNDCAEWAVADKDWWGINGEIWISVSDDDGMTWDLQRNLTNSYTPHCDPWGGTDCQSDYWATMSRWGKQLQAGEDWSGAEIVDPTGTATTDYFLDIMYVNDLDAGFALHGYGSWVNDPIKWFRIPCYPPEPNPIFVAEWYNHGYPAYVLLGNTKDTSLWFENLGNATLYYTITPEEDNGPAGWLDYSGSEGMIYAGVDNRDTVTVHLNKDNIITEAGTYTGRLHVEGPGVVNLPCDIEITLLVPELPIDFPTFDVVSTNCLSLVVSDYGNAGKDGEGKDHMDYYPEDCDSTATVYLFESSPFLGRIIDDDTSITSAIYGANHFDDFGFRGLGNHVPTSLCASLNAEVFESGGFVDYDSTVAFEKVWVAPADDCEFIIEYMRVWSFDGAAHDGLMIGEIIDWDVPWDYKVDDLELEVDAVNTGHADGPRRLLYQQGFEAYGANVDTGYPYNCQYNDERFAGNAFVESYFNGAVHSAGLHSGFCGENDVLVYPANLIGESFVEGAFYEQCMVSGLSGSDSTEDLHAAMTFVADFDLGPTDIYEVVTVLATIQQGTLADLQNAIDAGKAWYAAAGGMGVFADNDSDPRIDICQSCCELMGDFTHDGAFNPLDAVALVQWMWGTSAAPFCLDECDVNCSGGVDPLDAVYMTNHLWKGGPPPCLCSELP